MFQGLNFCIQLFQFFNNSIASHSTFFACDFIFCKCPYNSIKFFHGLQLCNLCLCLMFYFRSKSSLLDDVCNGIIEVNQVHNLVCLNILKHAKKIAFNIYLIIMGTHTMRYVKKYAKRTGHHWGSFESKGFSTDHKKLSFKF